MDGQFKILVVDGNTFENHVGEDYGDFKEVDVKPTKRMIQTYSLFFRGIIRSCWHDISKDIEIVIDTESDLYNNMFEQLQETMKSEENIDFTIRSVYG